MARDVPPSSTELGQIRLMFEQLRDDQELMHEAMIVRFDSLEARMDQGFRDVNARLSALEKTVADHSRKIETLYGMILDNREAIEKNREALEKNREAIEKNRDEIRTCRAEIVELAGRIDAMDERLREGLEPRLAAIDGRVAQIEAVIRDVSE